MHLQFTQDIVSPFWPLGLNLTTNFTMAVVMSQSIVVDYGMLRNIDIGLGALITHAGFTMVSPCAR